MNENIQNAIYAIRKGGKWYASENGGTGNADAVSWNDLTDRPFGEEAAVINWNGDSTDKVTVDGIATKVSDAMPVPSNLIGGTITMSDGTVIEITADVVVDLRESGTPAVTIGAEAVFIAYGAIAELEVTETGIYFTKNADTGVYVSSLSYTTVKKIDSKYLPSEINTAGASVVPVSANEIGSFDLSAYSPGTIFVLYGDEGV